MKQRVRSLRRWPGMLKKVIRNRSYSTDTCWRILTSGVDIGPDADDGAGRDMNMVKKV